jgi:hypothetical protein
MSGANVPMTNVEEPTGYGNADITRTGGEGIRQRNPQSWQDGPSNPNPGSNPQGATSPVTTSDSVRPQMGRSDEHLHVATSSGDGHARMNLDSKTDKG